VHNEVDYGTSTIQAVHYAETTKHFSVQNMLLFKAAIVTIFINVKRTKDNYATCIKLHVFQHEFIPHKAAIFRITFLCEENYTTIV
jgi:hypothetical protein